jgi:hypothetical protein
MYGIYHVYTWLCNIHGICMVYTIHIPYKIFIGVPDVNLAIGWALTWSLYTAPPDFAKCNAFKQTQCLTITKVGSAYSAYWNWVYIFCIFSILFCIFCILWTIFSNIIKTCILLAYSAYFFAYFFAYFAYWF